MNQVSAIFKKLVSLEQVIQKMKVQAYFTLPKQQRSVSLYPQESVRRAVKSTRSQIWRRDYAKKVKGVS